MFDKLKKDGWLVQSPFFVEHYESQTDINKIL